MGKFVFVIKRVYVHIELTSLYFKWRSSEHINQMIKHAALWSITGATILVAISYAALTVFQYQMELSLIILRLELNGPHFSDDKLKCISLTSNNEYFH